MTLDLTDTMTASLNGHLLLWRHATAEDAHPKGDLGRQLTRRGEAEAREAAGWIEALVKEHGLHLKAIASPAVRACQTLEAYTDEYETEPAIAPGAHGADYLDVARRWLENDASALVLVGHQPSIGEAVAELMFGAPASVSVKKGAVWWFVLRGEERDDAPVSLRGVYSPA